MNLNQENELGGFLDQAAIVFKNRRNVPEMIQSLRERPELASSAIDTLTLAVNGLNRFIKTPNEITDSQRNLLPSSFGIKEILNNQTLPAPREFLSSFHSHPNDKRLRDCESFFNDANTAMERGEGEGDHEIIRVQLLDIDLGHKVDMLAMTFYAQRVFYVARKLAGNGGMFLHSLAEMVAIHIPESRMFKSAILWYQDKKTSDFLMEVTSGDIDGLFEDGAIMRETPNFQVASATIETNLRNFTRSIIIESKTPKGSGILLQAISAHNCGRGMIESPNPGGLSKIRFQAIGDFSLKNLRIVLGGFQDTSGQPRGSLPSLERMEELIRLGEQIYSHNASANTWK